MDRIGVAGHLMLLMSLVGSALIGWASVLAKRLERSSAAPAFTDAVTLLKPMHGSEPRLAENLTGFLDQRGGGSVQMLCGVQRSDDPAIAVVQGVATARPCADIRLIVDPRRHGCNAKVSNLVNLAAHARHDVLVLSDSDIAVGPDYLATVTAALAQPGVGAVTCLYRGRADAGLASRLVAMGIDLHFLPSTLIGLAVGLGHPCLGSTIALTRDTLEGIGGFGAFADVLADDHAIGAAVRAAGLAVAVPNLVVAHGCGERGFADLVRHELRWHRTIRGVDPAGYAGSIVLHPLPLALAGAALLGSPLGWAGVMLALAVRGAMARRVSRITGETVAWALLPVRDMLSFALFLASFLVRSVDWRGARLRIGLNGRLTAEEKPNA